MKKSKNKITLLDILSLIVALTLVICSFLLMIESITPYGDKVYAEEEYDYINEMEEVEEIISILTPTPSPEPTIEAKRQETVKNTIKEEVMVICLGELGNTIVIPKKEYIKLNNLEKEPEVSIEEEIVEIEEVLEEPEEIDEILEEQKEEIIEIVEEETTTDETSEDLELFASIPEGCYKVVGRSIEYITQEEFDLLVSIVSAEARGESFEGQVAVVDVILNRVDCSWYPDTVYGVLTQKGQFSTYRGGQYKTAPHTKSVVSAVLYALENKTLPSDVLFFRSGHYHKWGEPWKQIGNHYFSTSS